MMGTVEQVTKSKSGKAWRVLVGGKWYGAKFDSKLDEAVGKPIDFAFDSDPKFGDWIQSWMFASTAPVAAKKEPQKANGHDRWWINFVSNCCGQGIAHGVIKAPNEIGAWAKAAREAIEAVDTL